MNAVMYYAINVKMSHVMQHARAFVIFLHMIQSSARPGYFPGPKKRILPNASLSVNK